MKVRVYQDSREKVRRGARKCPWSVAWRENGRRRSKAVGTKEEAEKFAVMKRAELVDDSMGIQTRKRWSHFVVEYLSGEVEGSGKRPKTVKLTREVLAGFTELVQPTWVCLIDARALDTFRQRRSKMKGIHGQRISGETVKKELRHIRAALNVAKRWRYLREVPPMPVVRCDVKEKVHVLESHFLAMLKACGSATLPDPRIHQALDTGDWWRALLVTLWVTGMRIESVLHLRWEDLDWEGGRILSRAWTTKQRSDYRPQIAEALPYLLKIQTDDPRLLPWNHAERTLYKQFGKIQRAAGIELACRDKDQPGHVCNQCCGTYGFHAFRYAHARFNAENPQLQNQMGHAVRTTTDHYRKWAHQQLAEYQPYMPSGLSGGKNGTARQKNGKQDGGERVLRVVGA